MISTAIISTHVKISRLLWKFLSSTYFCCQTTSVTAFKPWRAFTADSTIMAGKWPVTFFGGAWHFAYIRGIQQEKYVSNEVYGKSCNYTLHFIEYRDCLICETKAGGSVKAGKKSTYSRIFKGSCQLFSTYKILMASDKMKNVPKCIIWPFFPIAVMFKELNRWVHGNICFTRYGGGAEHFESNLIEIDDKSLDFYECFKRSDLGFTWGGLKLNLSEVM